MLSLERQRIGHEGIRRVHEALETKGYKGAAQKRSAGAEARAEARKLGKLLVR